jgi:hypothetical protein
MRLRIRSAYQSVKESSMFESWPWHGGFSLYPFALVIMQVSLLVDEIDAEEIIYQIKLLLIPHPVELARHLVVFHQLYPQQARFIERLSVVSMQVGPRMLFQSLNVALFVLK